MTDGHSLGIEKVVSLVAGLCLLMAGWLFTLIITGQAHVRDRQEELAERVSTLEATTRHLQKLREQDFDASLQESSKCD